MIKSNLFYSIFFSFLFLISCNTNDEDYPNNNVTNKFVKNFGSKVKRDFIGQIVDVNNNPIQNVTVTVGEKTIQTDVNGVFIINNTTVFEQFAHIKVVKTGYIDGSRSIVPTLGKNNVRIMMISNEPTHIIQSGVANEISLSNGTKIKFDGAFENEFGSIYSGVVNVSVFHLNPTNDNIEDIMPGMLYAEDKNGEEKGLETFGMLHVQLTGIGGQKLQIATGHTAEMSLQIDNTQTTTAPNTIPLWHFDEVNGYWKEEGYATRQGNKYIGNVSHFSWWNCDIPVDSIIATLKVVDELNNPLSNINVQLVRENSYTDYAYGISDSNGLISGFIPANEILTMNVYDNCENIIHSTTIGPYISDTILPNIVVSNSQLQSSLITGTLLKCDNSLVSNGYVYIEYENQSFLYYVSGGSFSINFLNCSSNSTFSLLGIDSENNAISTSINGVFTGSTINIGEVLTCNSNGLYNLIGEYTVVVTRNDGSSRVFTNELISFNDGINFNSYKTTTTGHYTVQDFQSIQDAGFRFNIDSNGKINIPEQTLFSLYTNIVKGQDQNNGIDGNIINNNSFQLNYEISFSTGPKSFTAVYTRN